MNFLLRGVLAISFLLCSSILFSQTNKELSPGYYVVVGAYAGNRENIAQNYVDILTRQGHSANYGFNTGRNLYFVYLRYDDQLKSSLQEMQKKRMQGFPDAWVRVVPGVINRPVAEADTTSGISKIAKPQQKEKRIAKTIEPERPNVVDESIEPVVSDEVEVTDNPEIVQHKQMTLGNTEVFLSLFNARNNVIIDGDILVIDTERTRQLTKVKGNEYLLLPDPKSKSGQLTLICESFGYRKIQHEINYPVPLADTVKPYIDLMGTTIVIKFDMVRYHKGDIATLYNVYFYNDAAIMLPESKFELNSLLQMMRENRNYKIRLHGHTNGNYHGKIIGMGPEKNFFSLEGSETSIGSAKDLSRKRAEIIKEYLIANDISAERIVIKAWAGKRPLYDRHGPNAKKNVRVEVEILEE